MMAREEAKEEAREGAKEEARATSLIQELSQMVTSNLRRTIKDQNGQRKLHRSRDLDPPPPLRPQPSRHHRDSPLDHRDLCGRLTRVRRARKAPFGGAMRSNRFRLRQSMYAANALLPRTLKESSPIHCALKTFQSSRQKIRSVAASCSSHESCIC